MNRKIIALGLVAIFSIGALTSCGKDKNTEPKKEYVVSNDYVDVVKYKGLETLEYVSTISEDEVDNYIQYIMNYTASNNEENPLEPGVILEASDLTDEMVKAISNNNYSTVLEYRAYIRSVIEEQSALYFEENTKDTLFSNMVLESKLKTYDEARLQDYIEQADDYYKDYAQFLEISFEELYREHLNCATLEEYNDFIRTQSIENLKKEYIIKAIASAEKIEISDDEIDTQIIKYIEEGYFIDEAEVMEFITRDEIATNLKYQRILDLIYVSAVFVEDTTEDNGVTEILSPGGGTITFIDEDKIAE